MKTLMQSTTWTGPKTVAVVLSITLLTVLLAITALGASGGGSGPGPAANPGTGTPLFDPASVVTLEGPVVSFVAGPGVGTPTLTLDDAALGETAVHLGPYWFLIEADFAATAGDVVRLTAFACPVCNTDYVALSVDNLTTGTAITLRKDDGTPLWLGKAGRGPAWGGEGAAVGPGPGSQAGPGAHAGRCPVCGAVQNRAGRGAGPGAPGAGFGHGPGPGSCFGLGPDVSAAITVTGNVTAFTGGPGVGMPLLTLTAAGEDLSMVAGPWRVWIGAGFLPTEGQELTATYAPVDRDGETFLVALTVTDPASGLTVVLRDLETGKPLGSRG